MTMIADRTRGDTPEAMLPETRWIHPAVIVPLDADMERLGERAYLSLARRHAGAFPFLCTVPSVQPGWSAASLDADLRRAFETVTDLGARAEAILAGYHIEDAIRVYLPLFLGSPAEESDIVGAVEAVHRTAAAYFDQTRVEVHLLALLPDLARFEGRRSRYALAYRQLAALDTLGDPARPLGLRDRAPTDYRWILDCRTGSGAYAGALGDVLEPAAEVIALLLEGRTTDPFVAVESASDRLTTKVHGRIAGFSTFGVGALVHRRRQLARLLAVEAALDHLCAYGYAHPRFESMGTPSADMRPKTADPGALLAEWGGRVASVGRAGAARGDTARPSTGALASLEVELGQTVRNWLDAYGLAQTAATLRALIGGETDGAAEAGGPATLSVLYARWREDLERFLELAELRARVRELSRIEAALRAGEEARRQASASGAPAGAAGEEGSEGSEGSEVGQESEAGEDAAITNEIEHVAKERGALEFELQRREVLLDPTVDLAHLESELLAIASQRDPEPAAPPPPPPPPPAPPSSPPTEPPPVDRAARRAGLGGWLDRLRRRREARQEPPVSPPPAEVRADHRHAAPPPVDRVASRQASARDLIDRRRWLEAYAATLNEVQQSLDTHAEDVAKAAEYYGAVAKSLARIVTRGTNFTFSTIGKTALERYRATYVRQLREALSSRDEARLSERFQQEPREMREWEHPLNVALAGFDAALEAIAREQLAPVLVETITDVLAGGTPVGKLGTLDNVARMLIEASQPLARPAPAHPAEPLRASRWVVACESALELLRAHASAAAILDREGCRAQPTSDDDAVVVISVHHGFAAQSIRKLLEFRSESLRGPTATVLDGDEPIALDALAVGPTESVLRTLILASRLGLAREEGDEFQVTDDLTLPTDLVEAVRMVTTHARSHTAQQLLEARLDDLLRSVDGVDRLRRAAEMPDLSPTERRVLLEALVDLAPERDLAAPRQENPEGAPALNGG
jgi:hypothetical protein